MTHHIARQMIIVSQILKERDAQDALFGRQDDLPNGTGPEYEPDAVNYADAYRESCERAFVDGRGTFRHVFLEEVFEAMAEDDPVKLRAELVQAVAVGVKWLEAIDKQEEESQ
ncbi:hypothetical protein [Streptomyces sp. MH60]|uniref:hypothetical protein n=1 Tax=Streptomyces sp. MH60 TaxID=1940758 RepID=UPI000CED8886|nr:hypothetical protein [Streptomyces sp. MH60]PPS86439.1 hypothetical protein BZZ08_03406 [Streptomyces sp. MH60]